VPGEKSVPTDLQSEEFSAFVGDGEATECGKIGVR
jgi:hypothetical protein